MSENKIVSSFTTEKYLYQSVFMIRDFSQYIEFFLDEMILPTTKLTIHLDFYLKCGACSIEVSE